MNKIQLLDMLTRDAIVYRKNVPESLRRNCHMNEYNDEPIPQNVTDAILVDFINFIGMRQGVDYALYTKDLEEVDFEH